VYVVIKLYLSDLLRQLIDHLYMNVQSYRGNSQIEGVNFDDTIQLDLAISITKASNTAEESACRLEVIFGRTCS